MNVVFPQSLSHACEVLSQHPDAVPIAGGTDLLVHWPSRPADHDRTYIDLSRLGDLRHTTRSADALTLGALTTYWDVLLDAHAGADFPLLLDAARQVGAVQIQTRGTWAGNIANGSPAADGVPALMALGATVQLVSSVGTRSVPLDRYYTGYRASVKSPTELIASITLPRRTMDVSIFCKVGPRRAQAITKVGLAITHEAGAAGQWRVVANSVGPTVRRCPGVEALLTSGTQIRSPAAFMDAAASDIAPIDDIRSTADYRREVFCRLLYHALKGRAPGIQ